MTALGRTVWVLPAGRIPVETTGREPDMTSRDELCVLNTGDDDAHLSITVYHRDREPVGPYTFDVGARRVRAVRFNDFIDPEPIELGVDYAAVVESDVPVVVQHMRVDTRAATLALYGSVGYAPDPR